MNRIFQLHISIMHSIVTHVLFFVQFSSVQFIQFHQIDYKSKRPIGYRISHSIIYIQILMHKDSIHEVTIINIWLFDSLS